MGGKLSNMIREGLRDKVRASVNSDQSLDIRSSLSLHREAWLAYLNDMITVIILDAIDDSTIEF